MSQSHTIKIQVLGGPPAFTNPATLPLSLPFWLPLHCAISMVLGSAGPATSQMTFAILSLPPLMGHAQPGFSRGNCWPRQAFFPRPCVQIMCSFPKLHEKGTCDSDNTGPWEEGRIQAAATLAEMERQWMGELDAVPYLTESHSWERPNWERLRLG